MCLHLPSYPASHWQGRSYGGEALAAIACPWCSTQTNPCSPPPRSTRRGWTSESWRGRWANGTSRTRVTMRVGSSLWQSTHCPGRGCQPTGSSVGASHPGTTRCRGWPSASVSSEASCSRPGCLVMLSSCLRRGALHAFPAMNCSRGSSFQPKLDTPRGRGMAGLGAGAGVIYKANSPAIKTDSSLAQWP